MGKNGVNPKDVSLQIGRELLSFSLINPVDLKRAFKENYNFGKKDTAVAASRFNQKVLGFAEDVNGGAKQYFKDAYFTPVQDEGELLEVRLGRVMSVGRLIGANAIESYRRCFVHEGNALREELGLEPLEEMQKGLLGTLRIASAASAEQAVQLAELLNCSGVADSLVLAHGPTTTQVTLR